MPLAIRTIYDPVQGINAHVQFRVTETMEAYHILNADRNCGLVSEDRWEASERIKTKKIRIL
uniref:Uncharacterized protein n=1 Tax=Megaselia scalaris TaxID=36166 RepID=T1GQU6_MEGSC